MAKKSVLIVDDSPFVRNALRGMFLPVSDFEVSGEAENGQDAIDKAELLWPDLIILDLTMDCMQRHCSQKCCRTYELYYSRRTTGRKLSGWRNALEYTPL